MPDEETLARWVDDELDAASTATVDAWASAQPEWLARREQARRLTPILRGTLPAAEEPPYADFFNARINREIAREAVPIAPAAPVIAPAAGFWNWFLPATAVAGMALCFWVGTRVGPAPAAAVAGPELTAVDAVPVVYTPEKGVKAAYYSSSPADAMVIVLDGVAAIPDSFEIPETASVDEPADATAGILLPAP